MEKKYYTYKEGIQRAKTQSVRQCGFPRHSALIGYPQRKEASHGNTRLSTYKMSDLKARLETLSQESKIARVPC